jgi:hypothetical protein
MVPPVGGRVWGWGVGRPGGGRTPAAVAPRRRDGREPVGPGSPDRDPGPGGRLPAERPPPPPTVPAVRPPVGARRSGRAGGFMRLRKRYSLRPGLSCSLLQAGSPWLDRSPVVRGNHRSRAGWPGPGPMSAGHVRTGFATATLGLDGDRFDPRASRSGLPRGSCSYQGPPWRGRQPDAPIGSRARRPRRGRSKSAPNPFDAPLAWVPTP